MTELKERRSYFRLRGRNWFLIGLLFTGGLLAIISLVGLTFNPDLFMSFSWFVVGFLVTIAVYMLYNFKKLSDEIKEKKK